MAKFDFSDLNSNTAKSAKFDFSDLNSDSPSNDSGFSKIPHAAGMVASDVGHVLQALPGQVARGILNLPSDYRYLKQNIPDAANQIMTDSSRAGRNAVAGLAEVGHGALNTPSGMANYMSKIGLISPQTADSVPRQHDITQELNDFVGGKRPGDDLIRGTFGHLPLVLGAGSLAKNALSSTVSAATYPVRKTMEAVSDYKNARGIGEAEKQLSHIENNYNQATKKADDLSNLEGQAKSAAHIDVGTNHPDALQRKVNLHQEELGDINRKIEGIPEITTEVPKLNTNSQETFANLNKANETHEQAKQVAGSIENDMGQHLNKGAAHDVRAAARIDEIQTAKREAINKDYDAINRNLADKHIEISNPREAKDILGEITELVRSGKGETPEATKLADELHNLKGKEVIPANDYLTSYRSMKQYAREARAKAYTPGMNAEERAQWKQKYNDLDAKVDEMGKVLENGIGTENAEALRKANDAWRTKVVPLYKNTTYQGVRFKGRMPDNIMKSLRGTEPGDALMKDIIKNDPELLKNVVGQRYAHKPAELHEAGELEQEYLDKMPELRNALESHKQAQNAIEMTGRMAKNAQIQHEETLLAEKNASKVAEEVEKQRAKNQSLRDKFEAKKADLEKEISLAEKHAANLKRISAEKKLSLEEKDKIEKERKRVEELVESKKASQARLYKKGGAALKGLGILAGTSGGLYAGNKILNSFVK